MADNPIIWAMTERHHDAMFGSGCDEWEGMSQKFKDDAYDAMWQALHELRLPEVAAMLEVK